MRDEFNTGTLLNVQTIWSAIQHDPNAYLRTMKAIVDRVAYNADMDFSKHTFVPDENFVCPRLWQRICITAKGEYLKCPSDFTLKEILGDVSSYSVKEAWDILQEEHRQMHLSGRRLESVVCSVCHHGARKVPVTVNLDGHERQDFRYEQKDGKSV